MTLLRDQVAVVTGASSGIGAAFVHALAAQGARVCLVGRRLDALEGVSTTAAGASPHPCYGADLCVDEDIEAVASAILRDHGGIDILVHSAGAWEPATPALVSAERLDALYRTNVRAPTLLTAALLPALRTRQGQVVFVNSSAGLAARAEAGHYAATKHALKAFADSLCDEVNSAGVRVLSIYPGRTATPMQARVHAAEGRPYQPGLLVQPEDVAAMAVHALALPRRAEVTDIMIRPARKAG